MDQSTQYFLRNQTALIAAAYVSGNQIPEDGLPFLIKGIYLTLNNLMINTTAMPKKMNPTQSEIENSIRPIGLVSFIDGKTYKMLKRHLAANDLNPHSYRERYGLPSDYPMVASNYAEKRSAIAKAIRLGQVGSFANRHQ